MLTWISQPATHAHQLQGEHSTPSPHLLLLLLLLLLLQTTLVHLTGQMTTSITLRCSGSAWCSSHQRTASAASATQA
jgi:hypothetical protein